jgi:choline dehydrogenase-like flavoprotein
MHYVIGSGPSGIAAAAALLDRGVAVTMLDVGRTVETERHAIVERMSAREPEDWSPGDRAAIRSRVDAGDGSLPLKTVYGSTFPYAMDALRSIQQVGTNCLQSFAKGGLSNVWGAAVLPNVARDMADWPVSVDDLAPHYQQVARLLPVAAASDELAAQFPVHGATSAPLRPSRQARALLTHLRRHRRELESAGIVFGQSRLAVKSGSDDKDRKACRYTGLCLSGCPYAAIWNAADALDALRARAHFSYRPGLLVERVESLSGEGGVRIHAIDDDSGRHDFVGRRVLLACGPVSTIRIVIDSLRAYDQSIGLQFQPYFVLPLMALRNVDGVETERLHTLAQVFIEMVDDTISARTVHLQVYTFNEFIRERVETVTSWLGPGSGFARRRLLGRLLAIQGYFHSAEAPQIAVTSTLDRARGLAKLTLTAPPGSQVPELVRRVARKLARQARRIGAVPLSPMSVIGKPGDGNHVGGAFPLSRTPGDLETDLLGQLPRLPCVHIVDSSSLPSLAATTFTYTTMAHAHRIGDAVARLSQA